MASTEKKYNRFSKLYDVLEKPIERFKFSPLRERARTFLNGKILEVGIGTGKNMPYYPNNIEVIGIDFSKGMLVKAQNRKDKLSLQNVSLFEMDIENMSFREESFDTVLSAFVFCTVPRPIKGLQEVYRVLKSGGTAVFIEHMKSENPLLNIPLYMMNIFTTAFLGTSTIRETQKNIEKVGFKIERAHNEWFDIVRFIIAKKK
jgi:ubiquinone/menaquinone biosynthesis C-methylase UbiE